VEEYRPVSVGIEKGALKNAVLPYLSDIMKERNRYFRVEELTHGNQRKVDRIVWALQGRFEHGKIELNKGNWNTEFCDQLFQFPNPLVHDDLIDSLAYIDQLAKISYYVDYEEDEDFEFIDPDAGY
jgi:phage terminase large subunit-like protein